MEATFKGKLWLPYITQAEIVSIPTELTTLKTEATNGWLVSKQTAHLRPKKIYLVQNQVTTEYFYEWLLFTLGSRLLQGRGYHLFLPQVMCQKWKPQIDGLFLNELHI